MTCSRIFITGIAGFIGFNLARHYLQCGCEVAGADRLSPYYSPHLKRERLRELSRHGNPAVVVGDLAESDFADKLLADFRPDAIFHLAAQPGVRESDAESFRRDNLVAFVNILHAARCCPRAHFLFASSSSVYGDNSPKPLREESALATPPNLYAASKAANEFTAKFWALGGMPITAIRFFNVYGPWGRPDSAVFKFADAFANGRPATLVNGGESARSWLFIDDAVRACATLAEMPPTKSEANFRVVNIAGPTLIRTKEVMEVIARQMEKTPRFIVESSAISEMESNPADLSLLQKLIGETPQTKFEDGIAEFLQWHRRRQEKIIAEEKAA